MEPSLDPVFPACLLGGEALDRIAMRPVSNDLAIVLALPKSASTAFAASCKHLIPAAHTGEHFVPREAVAQGGMTRSIPISFGVLSDETSKGLWQSHAPYSHTSVELLRFFRVPIILLVRHPLDHLIALACHWRKPKLAEVLRRQELGGRISVNTALAPVKIETLREALVRDAVRKMIRDGYLFHVLSWVSSWIGARDELQSLVLRMEDLNTDPMSCFMRAGELLRASAQECQRAAAWYGKEFGTKSDSKASAKGIYPHGWTGNPQLWRAYCSKHETRAFNDNVMSFLSVTPHRDALTETFPDLFVG